MTSLASSSRNQPHRAILALCAALSILSGITAFQATAQQTGGPASPAATVEPGPPAAVFQNLIPANELAFLNDYAGHPAKELLKDKRFEKLQKQVIPRSEYHYGKDMPLTEASDEMTYGSKQPVVVRDGRYVTVSGAQGPYLAGRGFYWFDIQTGIALGGVYFHPTNGEPTPTLAVYSRQLNQTMLGLSELPLAFAQDLSTWSRRAGLPPVNTRYFIPENGKKYVLLHDEDYCDHPATSPAPPDQVCLQLNANAADIDLNAAYFMNATHNAANATAWMLGPTEVAWIGIRDRSCGAGPGALPCRIRLTRQRTRTVLHGA